MGLFKGNLGSLQRDSSGVSLTRTLEVLYEARFFEK